MTSKNRACEVCGATLEENRYIYYCSKANKVLCSRHRNQFNRLGYFLDDNAKKEDKVCEVCGATTRDSCCVCYCRKANKILCSKHLQQFYKYGTFLDKATQRSNIITHEDSAEIELKNKYGKIIGHAIIDLDDVERCQQHKWNLETSGYARTRICRKNIYLHRYLIKCPIGKEIDHVNRNRLDNRKSNLRIVSISENRVNTAARSNTGCKNITKTPYGTYEVKIRRDGNKIYQKRYNSLTEAIAERDKVISDYNASHNRAC